jgi:hypothetical protein
MTAEAITSWLATPSRPADAEEVEKALGQWPWFTPLRLMKAVAQGELAFPEKLQLSLSLYADHWLPVYQTLMAAEQEESMASEQAATTPEAPAFAAEAESGMVETEEPETSDLHPTDEQDAPTAEAEEQPLIQPLYTEDYFRFEGLETSDELPPRAPEESSEPQTLMVVMSFAEWLNYFKTKAQKEEEEAREKSALRSMWQQEKLAAAMEDDPEEIPEEVFEMAVSSITREDDLVSESLAQIYERQEKWGAAAEMYRKLALKYPAKSAYFAARADAAKKQLK